MSASVSVTNFEHFWISKSALAHEGAFQWSTSKNIPSSSKWNRSNRCVLWYWMNVELCFALWPLTNEWNYDKCDNKKYFICERFRKRGKKKWKLVMQTLTIKF